MSRDTLGRSNLLRGHLNVMGRTASYTVKNHRNRGLRRKAFSEINKYADEFSEAYSILSDPFVIKDGEYTNERNARHAIVKLATKHYEPAPNYMQELDEQRKRFLSYGLKNCEYANAEVINEYQSFCIARRQQAMM